MIFMRYKIMCQTFCPMIGSDAFKFKPIKTFFPLKLHLERCSKKNSFVSMIAEQKMHQNAPV